MHAILTEQPVVAVFEALLLGAFVWVVYMGLRAEWRKRFGRHPSLSLGRGETSWRDLSLAWVVVMGYAGPLIGVADLEPQTATLLHTLNASVVFHLVFVSEPGRNRVIRYTSYVRSLEE